ncbi:MAG: DUF6498-containing protein [Patescibacteria group bacterium]
MFAPNHRNSSLYALLFANLVPIFGTLFFGWDARDIILLYWFENVIVGFFTVLRMLYAPGLALAKFFLIPFFCFHFGMFTFVHGIFVIFLVSGFDGPGLNQGPDLTYAVSMVLQTAPLAALLLFLSHGYSFITNYIYKEERQHTNLQTEMQRPYGRITVIHLTIMAAAFIMLPLGLISPAENSVARIVPGLILTAIKTLFDARAHQKSHASRNQLSGVDTSS